MSEKVDTTEVQEPELVSLSKDDLDSVAGGGTKYYTVTHGTGCDGTFTSDVMYPPYCLLCGKPMAWPTQS